MAKRKLTENQKAFQKERRRLQQAIARAEKKGYIFPADIIPEIPKRVTKKDVEDIAKVKPKALYEKAKFVNKKTGEIEPAINPNHSKKLEQTTPKKTKTKQLQETKIKTPKIKKAELSAEEIKLRKEQAKLKRSESAKAYWKNLKENNPKEFQRRIDSMQRGRNKSKESTTQEQFYPSFNIIDILREKISELTGPRIYSRISKSWLEIPIEARKNALLEMLDDNITYYSDNLKEYTDYLLEKQDEIFYNLDYIQFQSSDEESVSMSFVNIAKIINRGPLSPSQAEGLNSMAELYDSYGG